MKRLGVYNCLMSRKRRVYIIHKTHKPLDQEILSNLNKVVGKLDTDISYKALASRIQRARERTGKL